MKLSQTISLGIALVIGLAAGCYGDEESFCERSAKLDCVRLEECNKSAYENRYDGNMDDCRDDIEAACEDAFALGELLDCDYDPPGGRDCIHAKYSNRRECDSDADDEISDECDAQSLCD